MLDVVLVVMWMVTMVVPSLDERGAVWAVATAQVDCERVGGWGCVSLLVLKWES